MCSADCFPGAIIPSYDILISLFSSSLIKNLLQSSASRKTQKKKKKKVSHWAVGLTEKNAEIEKLYLKKVDFETVPLIGFSFFLGLKEC